MQKLSDEYSVGISPIYVFLRNRNASRIGSRSEDDNLVVRKDFIHILYFIFLYFILLNIYCISYRRNKTQYVKTKQIVMQ